VSQTDCRRQQQPMGYGAQPMYVRQRPGGGGAAAGAAGGGILGECSCLPAASQQLSRKGLVESERG
jgi:hypothetical protein